MPSHKDSIDTATFRRYLQDQSPIGLDYQLLMIGLQLWVTNLSTIWLTFSVTLLLSVTPLPSDTLASTYTLD
ncbi:MAG: hypothetical protein U1E92_04445 [Moraxella osloensis]